MNPELARNLWLEISATRLVVMPAVLGGLFYLAHATAGVAGVAEMAWWAYLVLALLLGTRAAADAVSVEVASRTWDWQRLSSLGAWSLTWGKLAGAPVFAWYGASLCLLTLALSLLAGGADPVLVAQRCALLLLAALLAHATAFALSLLGVRKRDSVAVGARLWPMIAGLVLAWFCIGLEQSLATGDAAPQLWYDRFWLAAHFGLGTAVLFTALAWLAAYRLMRAELQMRNAPWVWLVASLVVMAWVAGLVSAVPLPQVVTPLDWWGDLFSLLGDSPSLRLLVAMLVALLMTYGMALAEPKSPVAMTRLLRATRSGDVSLALALLPRWCFSLLLAALAGAAALVLQPPMPPSTRSLLDPTVLVLAPLAFALRDLALLVLLHLSSNPRRADAAWVLYLGVLYALAPMLAAVTGLSSLNAWLLPRPDLGLAGLLPPLLEAAVVMGAVAMRWRGRRPA